MLGCTPTRHVPDEEPAGAMQCRPLAHRGVDSLVSQAVPAPRNTIAAHCPATLSHVTSWNTSHWLASLQVAPRAPGFAHLPEESRKS